MLPALVLFRPLWTEPARARCIFLLRVSQCLPFEMLSRPLLFLCLSGAHFQQSTRIYGTPLRPAVHAYYLRPCGLHPFPAWGRAESVCTDYRSSKTIICRFNRGSPERLRRTIRCGGVLLVAFSFWESSNRQYNHSVKDR